MQRRKRAKWLIALGTVALLAGLWQFPPRFYRDSQEPIVQETLARHLLQGWSVETGSLTLAGAEAPKALLQRLSDLHVKLNQGASLKVNGQGQMVDSRTGKPAVQCELGPVRWLNATSVEVEGAVSEGLMGSSSSTYYLRRSFHGWEVVADVNTVAS